MGDAGAVPALLLLIQRGTDATVEAATRCLANVMCDSEPTAAAAADAGAIAMLVVMLRCGRDCLAQVCLHAATVQQCQSVDLVLRVEQGCQRL